jgi:hypothetical protein
MKHKSKSPILIAGIPRSGTTWLSNVLVSGGKFGLVHEPDNERHTYSAYYYKRNLRRFPFLRANDKNQNYYNLFYNAINRPFSNLHSFSNKVLFKLANFDKLEVEKSLQENSVNNPDLFKEVMWLYPFLPKNVKKQPRIIKSVHCVFSLEYILNNFKLKPVVIIRHPAAVISSYLKMNNPDMDRRIYKNKKLMNHLFQIDKFDVSNLKTKEAKAGLQVAIFYKFISQFLIKKNEIPLVKHEDLCLDPLTEFKNLFKKLNLNFNQNVIDFIVENNVEGTGYDIKRSSNQAMNAWKSDLNQSQIDEIKLGYNLIPPHFYSEFS